MAPLFGFVRLSFSRLFGPTMFMRSTILRQVMSRYQIHRRCWFLEGARKLSTVHIGEVATVPKETAKALSGNNWACSTHAVNSWLFRPTSASD